MGVFHGSMLQQRLFWFWELKHGHFCVQNSLVFYGKVLGWVKWTGIDCLWGCETDEPNWLSLQKCPLAANYIKKLILSFWERTRCSSNSGALQAFLIQTLPVELQHLNLVRNLSSTYYIAARNHPTYCTIVPWCVSVKRRNNAMFILWK